MQLDNLYFYNLLLYFSRCQVKKRKCGDIIFNQNGSNIINVSGNANNSGNVIVEGNQTSNAATDAVPLDEDPVVATPVWEVPSDDE
jgi:hypothetical protein